MLDAYINSLEVTYILTMKSTCPYFRSGGLVVTLASMDSSTNEIYVAHASDTLENLNSECRTNEPGIYVFTENGKSVKSFKHKCLKCPYGIAIHETVSMIQI